LWVLLVVSPALALAQAQVGTTLTADNSAGDTVGQQAPPSEPKADEQKPDEKKDGEKKDGEKGDEAKKGAEVQAQAQPQNAIANAVQARTPEEQANQSGFQFAFGLDHFLGTGTFVNPQLYASLVGAPSFSATYLFGVKGVRLAASARVSAFYEYTLPDTPNGRRFFPQDTRLSVVAPALFRDKGPVGIAITPSLSAVLPTSPESWTASMIATVGAGAAVTRSVKVGTGGFDFRLTLAGSYGIFGNPVNGIRNVPTSAPGNRDALGNLIVIGRPDETFAAVNGMNPAVNGTLGGSVNWRTGGNLLLFAGYSYTRSWNYAAVTNPNDPTLPRALDSNGNPVAHSGMGGIDITRAFFGASYQLNEHYNLDLYLFTLQTPLVRQGDRWVPRFPIGSPIDSASNNTSIVVSLGAAY
jgi:hypothetical protein